MPLEVGENVFHQKRIALRHFQWRIAAAIVKAIYEGGCRGEKIVEVSPNWIVNGIEIGDPAVVVDGQVGDMARIAADPVEDRPSQSRHRILLSSTRLEVVQKIELKMVHDRGIEFVLPGLHVS